MNDKAALRRLKGDVVAELVAARDGYVSAHGAMLDTTDARIMEYALSVIDSADAHNLYELLSVRRFFTLLSRYEWRPKAVAKFLRFYEKLKFNGVNGRRRYRLTPVQAFQFASIFGFYTDAGRRLTRTAYIFVPRKFSKTTSAAALAVYDMLFGDANAQAYIGANSYDQAKICFDEIRAIMRGLDPAERTFRINREKITFRSGGRDSLIQCLTANARTKDGLNASLIIMDEYAQARNTAGKNGADLKNVLTSSMGARRDPLTVIITTASDVLDGPFFHELEGVKAVLRGEQENDRIFASLFMPDVDDAEDDPYTWEKVQPHMGVTVQRDFYANEYAQARLSAENMLAFRTKLLNIFCVNEATQWFDLAHAQAIQGSYALQSTKGRPRGVVAFDLSVKDDFSAVAYVHVDRRAHKFYGHIDYYFPEGALAGHPNEQLYRRWVEQGYLRLCKGAVIDNQQIGNDIFAASRFLDIKRIAFDSYKAQGLRNYLAAGAADKSVLRPYSQTYGSFNKPVETFEYYAYHEPPMVEINSSPINTFCLLNCVISVDNLENKKPVKAGQHSKIDGVIALLMGIGAIIED